jgi:dethiobiotin synthetase
MGCGFFVTGTDTGVGKTTFAVALMHALRQRGLNVAAMKPVAAGCEGATGQLKNDDVIALSGAANVKAHPQLINPYAFIPPIAPHIAAARTGVAIELDKIKAAYAALSTQADVVVVEGVGGFRVPLGAHLDTTDMARALDLPIILVVGVRLGCLNHALLTAEAIEHRGLKWAGWVANILEPNMDALDENIAELEIRMPSPCLGSMSRCHTLMTDPVAAYSMQWLNFPEA